MEKQLEKILIQTENLIKAEKYEEALAVLKEEIANPLNSLEIQNELQAKYDLLTKFLKQNAWDLRLAKADKAGLIKIFNTEGYEHVVLALLLDKFAKQLTVADCYRLQQVFLDDSIPNQSKIQYLQMFKDGEIKFKFQYHNTLTNQTFEVDTSKDFDIYVFEDLFKVYDKLQALYFKETSKDQLARTLINSIYYYYFNDYSSLPYNGEELFNHIVDYVEHAFNSIYPSNDKFSNWINQLMK